MFKLYFVLFCFCFAKLTVQVLQKDLLFEMNSFHEGGSKNVVAQKLEQCSEWQKVLRNLWNVAVSSNSNCQVKTRTLFLLLHTQKQFKKLRRKFKIWRP